MKRLLLLIFLLLLMPGNALAKYIPVSFTDSSGREVVFTSPPCQVVSLVPSISEIIMEIGAGDCLLGTTHHSVLPAGLAGKSCIGGFFSPDLDRVEKLAPKLIFYSSLHSNVEIRFAEKAQLVTLATTTVEKSFEQIRLLGKIFNRSSAAEERIADQKRQLTLMQKKVARIAPFEKKRVMRIMGRDRVMTPGEDSFQNEYIEAAGGIAPRFGRTGAIISVSLEEWQRFNPQFLYGCGGDRSLLDLIKQPGWNEVDAVKNNHIAFFPCDLTCRAATNSGYFVSWLGASIYGTEFGDSDNFVLPQQVVERRQIEVPVPYVTEAEVVESDIKDFRNRTALLTFSHPMRILSTLEGWRENILHVGNHYFPPPSWGLGHAQGLEDLRSQTTEILGLPHDKTTLLFTGADMNNLAIVQKSFRQMSVTALVTAGAAGNALRMAFDEGRYYEPDNVKDSSKPGTINILLLTNMQLTPRAMTRAIISATEAKTAALQDLDIRSSYSREINPASGTGTDNILVVEGQGVKIDSTGGHTKMGELIGRAAYEGVQKAIFKQNGFTAERSVFQRLREHNINLRQISTKCMRSIGNSTDLERLLLQPAYSSFIEAAFSISDAYERGLVKDLDSFTTWCDSITRQIGGKTTYPVTINDDKIPLVMKKALEALLTGLAAREQA